MRIILVLIFLSLILALMFLAAFFWAVKNGQYEDDHTPSIRMLWEEKKPKELSQKD
jgi:cbb3-type cytochrome oxidase maturation protein